MSPEKKVNRRLEFAYCYQLGNEYHVGSFPGRDGEVIGKGKTPEAAWKNAAKRMGLEK